MSNHDEQWLRLSSHVRSTKGYDQFLALCNRIKGVGNIDETKVVLIFQSIVREYGNNNRYYHNLDHVFKCLDSLSSVRNLLVYSEEIEFAIWFHDFYYNPRLNDNEEISGFAAFNVCKYLDTTDEFALRVKNLILATKHQGMVSDPDSQLICDIDLLCLALPFSQFNEYVENIRKEFSMYTKQEFIDGRKAFIESLLARPAIYQSEYYRNTYEKDARENLLISLSWLPNYPWQ